MSRIPTFDNNDYTQITDMGGSKYSMRLTWDTRTEAWYITLSEEDGPVIVSRLKLVSNWFPFIRQVSGIGGIVTVADVVGQENRITRDSLYDGGHSILYTDTEELVEIIGEPEAEPEVEIDIL